MSIFRDEPPPPQPPPQQPQGPGAPQQAQQPHQAAVPPVQSVQPAFDHADPRFALDAPGRERLQALDPGVRQDVVAAFKPSDDYISARGVTLQSLMDMNDRELPEMLWASKQFGALKPDDRAEIVRSLDNPHSFISLARMDVRELMLVPDKERPNLVKQSNDFAAKNADKWNGGPRDEQTAEALGEQFFSKKMLHMYGTIGFSNQVPLNETMRYQYAFVNAAKLGFDMPNVQANVDLSKLERREAEPFRHELRNSAARDFVQTAQTFGTVMGVEHTMVGRGVDSGEQQRAQSSGHPQIK
ncbi:hypothetical protein DX914_13565 [Lysobacter silvisoli]|uniref:Uncharacterized protein n=2 Tax=Lysobacter silvisoli TaxID=2293254 RepID=A0A371K023_9GAMM|nr:hypothetical protein DX914_13565 [Lysobacter silvisoli]